MIGKYECQLLLGGDPMQVMVDEYGRCNHEECNPESNTSGKVLFAIRNVKTYSTDVANIHAEFNNFLQAISDSLKDLESFEVDVDGDVGRAVWLEDVKQLLYKKLFTDQYLPHC